MRQPGVEVRPIEQLDGAAEFSEVFFTDARAPESAVVGGRGNGWTVAMTTLGFERGVSSSMSHQRFEKELAGIIDTARERGATADPLIRDRLVQQWIKVQLIKLGNQRLLFDALNGTHAGRCAAGHHQAVVVPDPPGHPGPGPGHPGPGRPGAHRRPGRDGQWIPGVGLRRGRPDYPASALQRAFLFSRSDTIGGGTSEIQLGIIAERILRLPRAR